MQALQSLIPSGLGSVAQTALAPSIPAPSLAAPSLSAPIPSTLPSASAIPATPTQSILSPNGILLGKLPLQLLTLFPPTGYIGLNLSAVGSSTTAMIKAAVYGIGIVAGIYANQLYVNQVASFLSFLLIFFPPWYIFDCIQILTDSNFDMNGFQLPMPIPIIPSGGGKGGTWYLTIPLLGLILASISIAGFAAITTLIPLSVMGSLQPYLQIGTGSAAALFGGGALIAFLLPSGSSTIPTSVPPLVQSGGRRSLPPLSSFMKQEGGSKEGTPFLGILALIIVGGFSLTFLRSKQA